MTAAKSKLKLTLFELALFAMFGAMMFASKKMMEFLPNVHLIGMFTVLLTVVYRFKALIPVYIYVVLDGLFFGFSLAWIPYLYIWAVLWAGAMLIPKNIKPPVAAAVYPVVCGLHGFLFGILYSPMQAIMFNLSFDAMISWIIAGIPFDIIHGVSNLVVGLLILPLSQLLKKLNKSVALRV